eukprot:scaffold699_cov385-Prasinococcus_capsulatus_cf.AAC.22
MQVARASKGEGEQVAIAEQIAVGATSFLKTEYTYLVPFVVVVGAFIVGVLEGQDGSPRENGSNYFYTQKGGWQTLLCFLFGAILSAACGWGGMKIATMVWASTGQPLRRPASLPSLAAAPASPRHVSW